MKISDRLEIRPGEIWAVTGSDAVRRSAWCARLARQEEVADSAALLSFAQHAGEAQKTGWPQARYYEDEGRTVADFLSYEEVYEINPFEVGARRHETRKAYAARRQRILRLLNLRPLEKRLVIALSNGETRRVLLARALAKAPRLLILDDPAAGLDVKQRGKLKALLVALAARGLAIVMAYRHADELPDGVSRWLRIDKDGRVRTVKAAVVASVSPAAPVSRVRVFGRSHGSADSGSIAPPVVAINHLTVTFGARELFRDFSWTVRRGEHWILRGENGSGKTTLMALVTGDSPLAYAADVRVFGLPRTMGVELAKSRSRIGMVSPEMQAYLGRSPLNLLDAALAAEPELLILDEPFLNLDVREAKRASRRIAAYLAARPRVTAILICHRADETPRGFTLEMNLDR